jgi:hypothetical protein
MAANKFITSGELFDIIETNPSAINYGSIYSDDTNPVLGSKLYTNQELTTVLAQGIYGLIKNNQTFEVTINASGLITAMLQYIPAPGTEEYLHYPPVALGVVEYGTDKEVSFTRSKLLVNTASGIKLSDIHYQTPFDTTADVTKELYFGVDDRAVAAARTTFSDIDLTDMAGFDLSPLIQYRRPNNAIGKWAQHYIRIPEASGQSRRIFQDGTNTYYWMPTSYAQTDSEYPDFYKSFPDFELPANKQASHSYMFEDDEASHAYTRKGMTYSRHGAEHKQIRWDFEQWARNLGMPPAYSDNERAQRVWNSLSLETVVNAFTAEVINVNKYKGLCILNWEVLESLNQDDPKMFAMMDAWRASNPVAKLAFWAGGVGAIQSRKIRLESVNNTSGTTPDLKFTGNESQWLTARHQTNLSVFQGNWTIYKQADIFFTDPFQQAADNFSLLHGMLMQFIMNKKFYPNKKVCIEFWDQIEPDVSELGNNLVQYKDESRNEVYKIVTKQKVDPATMFTMSLFAHCYMDGSDLFTDPYIKTTDRYYYGSGDRTYNEFDQLYYPTERYKRYPNHGTPGFYLYGTYKNLDWYTAGKWCAAQNADIIEATTPWEYLDFSLDNGATWITGDAKLPSETLQARRPVAIFKPNSAGTTGLLLFCHMFKSPFTKETYKVRLSNGNIKTIHQYGKYASCVRMPI